MSETQSWRCNVCGFVHHGAEAPEYCQVCGAGSEDFISFSTEKPKATSTPTAWRCLNCNYVHNGTNAPDECPVCLASTDRFVSVMEEEHGAAKADFDGHLVVVGAGIAGISAIESFRETNKKGTVTLLTREPALPYYRLNLTRFLAGEITEDALPIHPTEWFSENNVDLKLGSEVAEIKLEEQKLCLRDHTALPYDRIIIAAGAHAFVPPIVGTTREGVTSLRTIVDAKRIMEMLRPGMKCVCIGGGLLGLETAGALAAQKADVTLLESHDWLMPRQLNRRAGEVLAQHIAGLGITLQRNAHTKEILGDERAHAVLLRDGMQVEADLVIIATGVRPNSHLARRIGLDVNKGVVVDNHLTSSHPALLAAGDVAEHHGVVYGSWAASQFQGSIAGMNAAGVVSEFGGLPRSNTLKVLGLDVMSIGQVEPEDGSFDVLETDANENYSRFVLHDGRLVGSVLIGDTSPAGAVKCAIEERTDYADFLETGAEELLQCLSKK